MNIDRQALQRVVAVINGKGGVGKTSIATNVAGQLAAGGLRVLLVDADPQGNTMLDLGYATHPAMDQGKGFVDALWTDAPLHVIANIRPNLDVVPGGSKLDMATVLTYSNAADDAPGGSVPAAFALKLAQIAEDYDLVLIDGAPQNRALQEMALAAAKWVIIPTKTDKAGWEGLRGVGPIAKRVRRDLNPGLAYLGVVLFAHSQSGANIKRHTRAHLDEVADVVPLFDTAIRHSERTAQEARERGQLVHELSADAKALTKERLNALARRRRALKKSEKAAAKIEIPESLSQASDGIAEDYHQLATEICDRIAQLEAKEGAR